MVNTINLYNKDTTKNFTSDYLSEGWALGGEIISEISSRIVNLAPFVFLSSIDEPSVNFIAKTLYGGRAVLNGLEIGKTLFFNKNDNSSRLKLISKAVYEVGIGGLLISSLFFKSSNADLLFLACYELEAAYQSLNVIKDLGKLVLGKTIYPGFNTHTKKEIAKIIVDSCFAYMKFQSIKVGLDKYYAENYKSNYDQRYLEIQESDKNFIFKRDSSKDSYKIIPSIVENAYNIVQSKADKTDINFDLNHVDFNDFDHMTCSAMALDFTARHITKCKDIKNTLSCVEDFKSHYTSTTDTFSSIQTAFNSIEVTGPSTIIGDRRLHSWFSRSTSAFECFIKKWITRENTLVDKKMQSLANYHDLILTPASQQLSLFDGRKIKTILDDLPIGTYVMRMVKASGTHKLEDFGHTVSFIKGKNESLMYDNFYGLENYGKSFIEKLLHKLNINSHYGFLYVYKAECPAQGCTNLA